MVCKGTWSRIDLMSPKVFKYILFHLVFRGGSLSWRANSQELFFLSKMHILNSWEPTLTYWSAGYCMVLNGMSDLIRTNNFSFHLLIARVFAYTQIDTHSLLWDNNTNCLIKLIWMLIKLNVLTLHSGNKIYFFCVVKVIPFFTSHSFFSFIKFYLQWQMRIKAAEVHEYLET